MSRSVYYATNKNHSFHRAYLTELIRTLMFNYFLKYNSYVQVTSISPDQAYSFRCVFMYVHSSPVVLFKLKARAITSI